MSKVPNEKGSVILVVVSVMFAMSILTLLFSSVILERTQYDMQVTQQQHSLHDNSFLEIAYFSIVSEFSDSPHVVGTHDLITTGQLQTIKSRIERLGKQNIDSSLSIEDFTFYENGYSLFDFCTEDPNSCFFDLSFEIKTNDGSIYFIQLEDFHLLNIQSNENPLYRISTQEVKSIYEVRSS